MQIEIDFHALDDAYARINLDCDKIETIGRKATETNFVFRNNSNACFGDWSSVI